MAESDADDSTKQRLYDSQQLVKRLQSDMGFMRRVNKQQVIHISKITDQLRIVTDLKNTLERQLNHEIVELNRKLAKPRV